MSRLLEVADLSVTFDTEDGPVHAVDGVSFSLDKGEILAVVGESGCGKSVTAMTIPRLLPPTATITGSIVLDGVELTGVSEADLRRVRGKDVTVVFQEPMTSLNPAFPVGMQVREVVQRHERVSKAAAQSRAVELLDLVGIPDAARRVKEFPHQLSGGMRQRVMIAIAVACSPKVLIADEPTTALDVTIQAGILDIMRDLRDRLGTSIILITHDLGVVADLADRVMVMYAGRRVEQADVGELFAAPQHPYTNGLLGAIPRAGGTTVNAHGRRRLVEIGGLVPSLKALHDRCTFAPRCPRATQECVEHRPPLAPTRPSHLAACYHPGPDPAAVVPVTVAT
jgi:peptide/nickel transport system ATP-binding protein